MHVGPGGFMPTPDVALSVRKITREGSERIVEAAFSLAARRKKRVTVVHKANVLRLSDGFFLACARRVAERYPDVACEERLVDAMAALLIRDPSLFDVIVTTNMFGDILSDEASEIAGSLGIGASLNAGHTYAVAQAQHGSAPDIAGKDLANPSSLIESAAMLLSWLDERGAGANFAAAGQAIVRAVDATIAVPAQRTRDLGGPLGTKPFTARVVAALKGERGRRVNRAGGAWARFPPRGAASGRGNRTARCGSRDHRPDGRRNGRRAASRRAAPCARGRGGASGRSWGGGPRRETG